MDKSIIKKIVLATLCIICTSSLAAVTVDQYVAIALEKSSQVSRYEANRENSLLALQKEDAQATAQWTVNLGTLTYTPLAEASALKPATVMSLAGGSEGSTGFSVSFPETENGITYSTGLGTSLTVSKDTAGKLSTSASISPKVSLVKSFDLGYVYDVDDLVRAQNLLDIETRYQTSLLNFQISFLNDLKSIMSQQLSVENDERNLDDAKQKLEKNILLKKVTEGTINYINLQNAIDKQQIALDNSLEKLEIQKTNFQIKYSMPYEDVEISETEVPQIEALTDGNSTVLLANYEYQLAAENLKAATSSVKSLSTNASLSGSLGLGNTTTGKMTASAGVSYSEGNSRNYVSSGWSASGNLSLDWDINNSTFSPKITLGAKYAPSNTSEKDQLEIKDLEYKENSAKIDYDDALSSYLDSVVDMKSSCRTLEGQIRTAQANLEYQRRSVETEQAKLDLGMATEAEVDAAKFSEKQAVLTLNGYYIDAIILGMKISLLQL